MDEDTKNEWSLNLAEGLTDRFETLILKESKLRAFDGL